MESFNIFQKSFIYPNPPIILVYSRTFSALFLYMHVLAKRNLWFIFKKYRTELEMIPDEEEENKTYIALVSLIQYDCHGVML